MNTKILCKPKLHTEMPQHQSEIPFANRLLELQFPVDNQPHVWFIKIPGLKDIDAVIFIPKTGLFLIEMKSWPISGISHISSQHFELDLDFCRL